MNTQQVEEINEPTSKDLIHPLFNAVWNVIKTWDLERVRGAGYAGATGTDVMTILNVVRPFLQQSKDEERKRCAEIARKMRVAKTDEAVEAAEIIATAIESEKYEN